MAQVRLTLLPGTAASWHPAKGDAGPAQRALSPSALGAKPCTVSLPAQGRAALTLQQAEALSWPALEGKILASLAWGGNAFTASCFLQISDG